MTGTLLTRKNVMDMLGVSERTVLRMLKSKQLKGFKVGREWRFEESDIQDYIKQQREKAAQEQNEEEVA